MSGSDGGRLSPAASRLMEAVMSAVEAMGTPAGAGGLLPAGVPVVAGRVHLGRLRSVFPLDAPVALAVGFGTFACLGPVGPGLGSLVYRRDVAIDRRGRLVLDRHARSWLAVPDPMAFDALVLSAPTGGVLIVPIHDYARRIEGVTP